MKREAPPPVLNILYYKAPTLSDLSRLLSGVFVSSSEPAETEVCVCGGLFHHNVFINSVFVVVQGSISLHSLPRLYIQMDICI